MKYETFAVLICEYITQHHPHYTPLVQSTLWNNEAIEEFLCLENNTGAKTPSLSLQELYRQYQKGKTLPNIIKDSITILNKFYQNPFSYEDIFLELNNIYHRIVLKLINYQKNASLLEQIPHQKYLDLAIVYYVLLEDTSLGSIPQIIHNCHFEKWHLSLTELHDLALTNVQLLLPAVTHNLAEFLDSAANVELVDDISTTSRFFTPKTNTTLLTNEAGINGAACLLYPGLLQKLAKQMQTNLIIIPSSINEVLIIPQKNDNHHDYHQILHFINTHELPKKLFLSENIYCYRRKPQTLSYFL